MLVNAWPGQQERRSASGVTQLQQLVNSGVGGGGSLQAALLDKTYEQIRQTYDAANGGFGEVGEVQRFPHFVNYSSAPAVSVCVRRNVPRKQHPCQFPVSP